MYVYTQALREADKKNKQTQTYLHMKRDLYTYMKRELCIYGKRI